MREPQRAAVPARRQCRRSYTCSHPVCPPILPTAGSHRGEKGVHGESLHTGAHVAQTPAHGDRRLDNNGEFRQEVNMLHHQISLLFVSTNTIDATTKVRRLQAFSLSQQSVTSTRGGAQQDAAKSYESSLGFYSPEKSQDPNGGVRTRP
jgi:hypothetical protein